MSDTVVEDEVLVAKEKEKTIKQPEQPKQEEVTEPDSAVQEVVAQAVCQQEEHEGPGPYLRCMREKAEIPEMEAASRMNISVQQLRALETNDYANLPAPIFVRNFLSRYADLLGLQAQRLIDTYERVSAANQPNLGRVSLPGSISSRHVSVRWVTYAVVAVIAALVLYWASSMGISDFWKSASVESAQSGEEVTNEIALPELPADDAPLSDPGNAN